MKFYIVKYKEYFAKEMTYETGVCDEGFYTEEEAIKMVDELIKEKLKELEDEFGQDDVETYTNETGDYQNINVSNGDSYEYSTYQIFVK